MSETRDWLNELGLARYADAFEANDIDLDVLRLLSDADLERLGVSLGHRRRLQGAVALLARAGAPSAATPDAPHTAGPEAAVGAVTSSATPSLERRQLTVMFCDLADSTGLAARLDPEDLQQIISAYRASCLRAIERIGGYVAKFMGDGVLAYFGYPAARADAADRAVHAGLGIVRAVAEDSPRAALAVRVGIATGEVVVGEQIGIESSREWSVVGDAPNLAARLQGAASPGEVLVADATRRLCRAPLTWSAPRTLSLKGFAEPVRAWVPGPATDARTAGADGAAGEHARLVGRRSELALVVERLELAHAGPAQVVVLLGEAGIGKSAVARALVARARSEGVADTLYYCSPFHETSELNPFVTQIEREAGIVRTDSPAGNLRRLSAWLARDGDVTETGVALFAALLGLPAPPGEGVSDLTPPALRAKTLGALEAHLLRADGRGPALIVVEDAHWMDPTSRDLLAHLVDRLGERRILLLVTARPEFDARWTRRPNVTLLTLNRLGHRDAATLVSEISGARGLPAPFVAELLRRAEGNPLFIEELAKAAAEALAGAAAAGDAQPLERLMRAIPTSLRDLLAERLDRLGPARDTAQAAAVIGQEFDLRLLEAIADEPSRRKADVERLVEAEIIVPRASDAPTAYAFRHALMQEAAYVSLLKSRRRELHRRIAEGLERGVVPELVDREPERVAQHYAEAGVVDRAIECWQQSGLRAAQRSANIEAIQQLTEALALVRQQPAGAERAGRELSLLVTLGPALQATGGWKGLKVREVYGAALALARETGRAAELYPALWGRWLIAHASGEAPRARELLRELGDIARELGEPDLLLQLHHAAGSTHFTEGEFDAALGEAEACMASYDLARHRHQAMHYGGHDPCVCTTCVGALAQFTTGRSSLARTWSDRALALAEQVEHAPSIAHAHAYRAELAQIRGDAASALDSADRALAIGMEKGLSQYVAWAKMTRGWALATQGDTERGLAEGEEGWKALRRTGVRYHAPHRLGMRAQAYAVAGRAAQAIDTIDEALAEAEVIGERWYEAELLRLKAQMLAVGGDGREIDTLLERAVDLARGQGAHLWECRARIDLAQRLALESRHAAARDILAPSAGWGGDVDVAERATAARILARLPR